ncbi:MAG: Trk system potassium transporter TrkA [Rhodospirillales bacterium]|nr:Trk system potassium transporter TrkA [Rhodospirillales bacterium]
MKAIVCGAGQVGYHIARTLAAEGNDVTVIDQKEDVIEKIAGSSDVRGIVGHAAHPDVLERAGASGADLLIAVTYADEVNMVACQVAHSLFDVPTKIARIRAQSYLNPAWANLFSRDRLPIDVVISPEIEVARAIWRRLQVPGASDMIPLADDKVRLIGVRCEQDCPIVNTPLRQLTGLFPDLNIVVVGIVRGDRAFVPSGDDAMLAGDEVFIVADTTHVSRALVVFGHDEAALRRIVILGGGNVGLFLAQEIEAGSAGLTAKIIELDKNRAELIAERLSGTMVLNGDALDPETLEEVNIQAAESVVAVTNDDETNILASLLAKRAGCKRAVTLVNKATYSPIVVSFGIDVVVSPRAITVSTILQQVRRGRIRSVHSLRDDFGEIIEAEALETSTLVNKPLAEAQLPDGVIIGALVRGDKVIIPRGDTVPRPGDRVILFAASAAVKTVEKMFAVRLEYF